MRPVDFIGKVVRVRDGAVVSSVEGTIFLWDDTVRKESGWGGTLLKWADEAALMAAHDQGEALLLVCNDGRRGAITLEPEAVDWGVALRFKGLGPLSEAAVPPPWRNLERLAHDGGAPDPAA